MQLHSFSIGHWMGTSASPRSMAGPHYRCSMEMLMLTLMSSSLSVEWARMLQQVGASCLLLLELCPKDQMGLLSYLFR